MNERTGETENWTGYRFHDYRFRLAKDETDFDRIHRLVYQTFVVEIRQHADDGTGTHIDKFHHKNRYLIAEQSGRICAMVAVHDLAPFSAADALPNPELLAKLSPYLLEVRLLLVAPHLRKRRLFGGLLWCLYDYAITGGYRYLLISGLEQRRKMYEGLGFHSLGDPVQRGQARFIPMLMQLPQLPPPLRKLQARLSPHMHRLRRPE